LSYTVNTSSLYRFWRKPKILLDMKDNPVRDELPVWLEPLI
jgi:hypothetical protein